MYYYEGRNLEGEISNFVKVWAAVVISLSYCYFSSKIIPAKLGRLPRLLLYSPVIALFLALPLSLHSMHLGGTSAFFLAWLANFKLLLLAFNRGPLSDPSLSLPKFIAAGSLPIKIQHKNPIPNPPTDSGSKNSPTPYGRNYQNPSPQIHQSKSPNFGDASPNGKIKPNTSAQIHQSKSPSFEDPSPNGKVKPSPSPQISRRDHKSFWNYAIKGLMVGVFVRVYTYSETLHPRVIMVIYCFHIYFMLELILAMVAGVARAALGVELESQFDEPYLSTSLQNFWGRRWNIMVSRTLRPTVYDPTLHWSAKMVGRKWAPFVAVFSTFLVSALMHELIFYYLGRTSPTWKVTWFFLLHAVSLMVEIGIKKAVADRWRLPAVVSTPLTVGYVMVTGLWLFMPELLRCKADHRAFDEYARLGAFLKEVTVEATVKFRAFVM